MVTLFLKPTSQYALASYLGFRLLTDLVILVENAWSVVSPKTNADGGIDENFWAQAATDKAAGWSSQIFGTMKIIPFAVAEGDNQSIPFDMQFFHDDDDDDDEGERTDSAIPGADGNELDLMATLAGSSRRVRPQHVNYTKAKKVGVRKLKGIIWKSLDIKVPNPKVDQANPWYESWISPISFLFRATSDMTDGIPSLPGR